MSALDRVIPEPRRVEIDHVDVAAPPGEVWAEVRHGDLGGRSMLVRALFAVRTLPSRITGSAVESKAALRIDDLRSTAERPGFQVLVDAPDEVVVGAIGEVWQLDIPFVHVEDAEAFARFAAPGQLKVAWCLRVGPRGEQASRVELELRVDATSEDAWSKFQRYFHVIGPASRFIRRTVLTDLAYRFGTPEGHEEERSLPGDELLGDARAQLTHFVDIEATPERVWPWLVQMGCGRAGFYSIDPLDNAGRRSAREVDPALQSLKVGDVIPATVDGPEGFEVLRLDAPKLLALGGLFSTEDGQQLAFAAPRPERFWHVTWTFVLERLDAEHTRLHVRARADFSASERLHLAWIRPVHALMERAQLHNVKARVEGRVPRTDLREVFEGLGGAAVMAAAMMTPFLRGRRSHFGLDQATAARPLPGDELIAAPTWSWTHGIDIEAPAHEVWPWVAQMGADRGGFYSYAWLENVAGCELRNAEAVHPEWQVRRGDGLLLHPELPPLPIVVLEEGRCFVVAAPADAQAQAAGRPWVAASWLFLVEPLGPERSRFISRFRVRCSEDLTTRLAFGATFVEPIGFVMDRRMLRGVKERAERARAQRAAGSSQTRWSKKPAEGTPKP